MWLAADPGVSGTGIIGLLGIAATALGAVAVAWLNRGKREDTDDPVVIVNNASPAIEAAVVQGAESAATIYRDELNRERREKDALQVKYDDLLVTYQALLKQLGRRDD